MGGLRIRQYRYHKIAGIAEAEFDEGEKRRIRAIVKVNVHGYVPDHVELRRRIDSKMFTAEFTSDLLGQLEADTRVHSVAVSEKLDLIE